MRSFSWQHRKHKNLSFGLSCKEIYDVNQILFVTYFYNLLQKRERNNNNKKLPHINSHTCISYMDIFMKLVFLTNSCAKIDSDKSDFCISFHSFILVLNKWICKTLNFCKKIVIVLKIKNFITIHNIRMVFIKHIREIIIGLAKFTEKKKFW